MKTPDDISHGTFLLRKECNIPSHTWIDSFKRSGFSRRPPFIILLGCTLTVGLLFSYYSQILRFNSYDHESGFDTARCKERANVFCSVRYQEKPDPEEEAFDFPSPLPPFSERLATDANAFQLYPWRVGTEHLMLSTSEKLILIWSDLALENAGRGRELFSGCPISNCIISTNKSLTAQSDAILFFASYMTNSSSKTVNTLPKRRGNQVFVYFQGESPVHTISDGGMTTPNFFNWTMTYRLDSDIRGHFTYRARLQRGTRNFAKEKTKLIVWFASHCNVQSHRDRYVRKLQQYIAVDTYGKCGNLTCAKGATGMSAECLTIIRQYKFFLAFENSVCLDYVTEKPIVALENGVVPVVLGYSNYSLLPPHSYIHVFDFVSPRSLANYLHYLDRNNTAYNEYLAWRYNPHLIRSHGEFAVERGGFCQLCQQVHAVGRTEYRAKSVASITDWWRGRHQSVCLDNWMHQGKHRLRSRFTTAALNISESLLW